MVRVLFLMSAMLWSVSATADPGGLVGVWQLKSFVVESVETKERRNVYGENPKGYVVITPERFTAIITGEGRKAAQNDEERANLMRTMFAYSGVYRVEGNTLTTKVDVSWNEAWTGTDQVRFFRLERDRLFIETSPAPATNFPQLGVTRGILEWERSK